MSLALTLLSIAHVPTASGQERRSSWRGAWQMSAEAVYDDNVFRLSESQRAQLASGAGADRFVDMDQPSDLVLRFGLSGSLRGVGLGSRRIEMGGGVDVNAFTANTRLTHVTLGTYATQSLTSRDEITLQLAYSPDEFRRNYLTGSGTSGLPTFGAGMVAETRARVIYGRELRRGTDHDLDLEVAVTGTRRSVADFPWRDRTEFAGQVELRAELGRRVDGQLTVARGRGSYDGGVEPFIDGSLVSTASLTRDFDETELGLGLRFNLPHRRELLLGWEHRIRDYVARLGDDPVYGDRRDERDAFEAELRWDPRGPLELRAGAAYGSQDTLRPARGDTTDEQDYRRTRISVSLRYSR